jgi:hypothetical protein
MRYAGCEKLAEEEEEGSTDRIQDADLSLHPVHSIMILTVAPFTQLPA